MSFITPKDLGSFRASFRPLSPNNSSPKTLLNCSMDPSTKANGTRTDLDMEKESASSLTETIFRATGLKVFQVQSEDLSRIMETFLKVRCKMVSFMEKALK